MRAGVCVCIRLGYKKMFYATARIFFSVLVSRLKILGESNPWIQYVSWFQ